MIKDDMESLAERYPINHLIEIWAQYLAEILLTCLFILSIMMESDVFSKWKEISSHTIFFATIEISLHCLSVVFGQELTFRKLPIIEKCNN